MLQLLQSIMLFKLIRTHYTHEKSYRRGMFYGHWHDYYQLLYVRKGSGEVVIGEVSYPIKEQDVVLLWPNEVHGITSAERMDTCELKFRLADTVAGSLTQGLTHFYRDHDGVINRTLRQIESDLVGQYNSELNALSLTRILLLMRQRGEDAAEIQQVPAETQPDRRLEKLDAYITANISRRFTVKEMADYFFVEYTHFSRKFHAEYGIRLQRYINRRRVDRVKELLTATNMTITEIAVNCGFENLSNLERNFKAEEGISPLQFRQYSQGVQAVTLEETQEDEGGIVILGNKARK